MDLRLTEIKDKLQNVKLKVGQIDPNGLCNAGCWFCPVKYQGNPTEFIHQMLPADLEKLVVKIKESSILDPSFQFIYTAHYNEILLYQYFEEMLEIFRKHKIVSMILSNGTTLTPAKTDLILKYRDVILSVHLNIPSFEKEDWAKKVDMNPKLFDNLVRNLDYFHKTSPYKFSVQINNASETSGYVDIDGIKTLAKDAESIKRSFSDRYPGATVYVSEWLIDRAGELGKKIHVIKGPRENTKEVIGCSHSADTGNRIFGWIHINATGDLFLCCNDYQMKYRFGNLLGDKSLDEIWKSDEHANTILQAYNEICKDCTFKITKG